MSSIYAPVLLIVVATFGFDAKSNADECDCERYKLAETLCEKAVELKKYDDVSQCYSYVKDPKTHQELITQECVTKCADTKATKKLTKQEVSATPPSAAPLEVGSGETSDDINEGTDDNDDFDEADDYEDEGP